ncbi:CD177 antigen-like [Peromyscus eremicus]|uniref:CD177 antigen-like n=1 Tax=Peromyscus eremicus TaxID=42410 RepID=UPI0027DDB4A7|nr:CD177 antigen-like [Peromyscus eremicus]XP_059136135.1 CD177 antigen-like [Peromyscus eremicus]XP_059136144.1 CD177 antigen-like [Peromyscus eremicus]
MAACCIQYFLLLFLLGFTPFSDTLLCKEGVMVTFGSGFPKAVVDWTSQGTKIAGPKEACYETLVLIDVGPKSLLVGSKGTGIPKDEDVHNIRMYDYSGVGIYPDNGTVLMYSHGPGILAAIYHETCHADLCNSDNTTRVLLRGLHVATADQSKNNRCPVCLHYWGSCRKNFVFCPKDTGCYDGEIATEGGGVNANFSIKGCLDMMTKNIFKRDKTLGIFSVLENVNSITINSSAHMFVPVTLAWVLGLGLSLALCLEGLVLSDEPIFL